MSSIVSMVKAPKEGPSEKNLPFLMEDSSCKDLKAVISGSTPETNVYIADKCERSIK